MENFLARDCHVTRSKEKYDQSGRIFRSCRKGGSSWLIFNLLIWPVGIVSNRVWPEFPCADRDGNKADATFTGFVVPRMTKKTVDLSSSE